MQEYLGSMEGAVLSGKLTAEVIAKDYPLASIAKPEQQETLVISQTS
jgi:15-cis-phytoene desaturase